VQEFNKRWKEDSGHGSSDNERSVFLFDLVAALKMVVLEIKRSNEFTVVCIPPRSG